LLQCTGITSTQAGVGHRRAMVLALFYPQYVCMGEHARMREREYAVSVAIHSATLVNEFEHRSEDA
jgi:hypothetical protein